MERAELFISVAQLLKGAVASPLNFSFVTCSKCRRRPSAPPSNAAGRTALPTAGGVGWRINSMVRTRGASEVLAASVCADPSVTASCTTASSTCGADGLTMILRMD
uniref:Secreted protein n=1 Tax=Globodera rostochiensis TaxID=31243 RepID=A0A914I740_GLORO